MAVQSESLKSTLSASRPESSDRAASKRRRWFRGLALALGLATALTLGLWIAVNRVEWLGPLVADSLRAVIGKDNVARLEDFAYRMQDRVFLLLRSGEKPKAYWEVPPEPASPAQAEQAPSGTPDSAAPKLATDKNLAAPFHPENPGPVHASWSAPGDGIWVPMPEVDYPENPVRMYKTLLHPDKQRSWAELFVVAIDLRQTEIHMVPGTREPVATEEEALTLDRPGRVLPEHEATVIAAFNGGFKTEHGRYGMKFYDTLIVRPREDVCTVARYQDNTMRIASWEKLRESEADMSWWRQTPGCMYEDNELHAMLRDGLVKRWGATLDGETVIRRSAIGISADGNILYVGISNHTTAPAIATGMNHAGSVTVAQLDINYSYPKFITFQKSAAPEGDDAADPDSVEAASGKRIAVALAEGFEFSEDEFIRKPSRRDFFYVMTRPEPNR